MTAVLSSMDPLRKERTMSFDDNAVSYSPGGTDWRTKYNEVLDMLAETKAELDEFHHASKELEAELEAELARTEQAQQDLKIKVSRAESERDDWKSKFMSLQTNHNTTTTSLQRELDKLRQEYQSVKVQLRELEMGNDDLERNERAISCSLADMEAKYSRVLEEKILLEQELLEKVHLEEETQRLKDELRDANEENSVLKNKLSSAEATAAEQASQLLDLQRTRRSEENLRQTSRPPDLDLSELSPRSKAAGSQVTTPKASGLSKSVTQASLQRASLYSKESPLSALKVSGFTRSITAPSLYSPTASTTSRLPTRGTPTAIRTSTSTSSTSTTASRNKGVQMVSEMRARVRNLEQRIHTKVPRLRMASITGNHRTSMSSNASASSVPSISESSSSAASNPSTAKTSIESQRPSVDSRKSVDNFDRTVTKRDKDSGGDSGWVLIMEDSPSPQKMKKESRRLSNPMAPTAFRGTTRAKSPSLSSGPQNSLAKSVGRRPPSRLSSGGGGSSIPTPVSRPTTPTFLPVPTGGSYSSSGLKRSTGPGGPNPYNQSKRTSLGSSTGPGGGRDRCATQPPLPRPLFDRDDNKALPQLPTQMNGSYRPKASSTSNNISSVLSKSRIGRPPSSSGRRNSEDPFSPLDLNDLRPRSGNYGR